MALRLMVYVRLLCQHLLDEKQISLGDVLPPVLPIVLFGNSPGSNHGINQELVEADTASFSFIRLAATGESATPEYYREETDLLYKKVFANIG